MPTDPAEVIANHYNLFRHVLPVTVGKSPLPLADEVTTQDTINVLCAYEYANNVTFVALDNDALAAVRETYDNLHPQIEPRDTLHATEGFALAVRDLLDLERPRFSPSLDYAVYLAGDPQAVVARFLTQHDADEYVATSSPERTGTYHEFKVRDERHG